MSKNGIYGLLFIAFIFLSACTTENADNTNDFIIVSAVPEPATDGADTTDTTVVGEQPAVPENSTEADAYPGPGGYPGPETNSSSVETEGILGDVKSIDEVEVQVPEAAADTASVGGVLMLERIDEETYYPLVPTRLLLGELIRSEEGDPLFLGGGDGSISGEVFETGAFIFEGIPPGTYGIVVDLAVTAYPVRGDDGKMLLFTVEGGDSVDLGRLLAEIPTDQESEE